MTTWGSAQSDSTNAFRIGYDISYSPSVGTGTSSVTVSVKLTLGSKYGMFGTCNWSSTGSVSPASGSKSYNHTVNTGAGWSSSNQTVLATVTRTVSTSYSGPVTVSGTATVSGIAAVSGSASVTWSITIPKRPVSQPAAPTSLSLSRGAGESLTASWTNHGTTGAPVDSTETQFMNANDNAWYGTGSVTGSSYTRSGAVNQRYRCRVRAKNTAGVSAWVTSGWVSTTPSAPGAPSAGKNAAGDIVVTWPGLASGSSVNTWEVWGYGGADPGVLLGSTALATRTYTHASPDPAKTWRYRIRAVSTGPTLYSPYSAYSNTVQLLTAPAAPTGLSPSGVVRDATQPLTLRYTYNSLDTSPQRKNQARYRINGGAWDERGMSTGNAQGEWVVAGGFGVNGDGTEWQVRTWGQATTGGSDGTGASPWSATAVVTLSSAPTAAVNDPSGSLGSAYVTATWGYAQAEGSAQAQWQARLKDASGQILETRSGVGAASSTTFQRRLPDAWTGSVDVRVQSALGLWSDWALGDAFTTDFPPPPTPMVDLLWLPDEGAVSVGIDVPAPGVGEVEPVSVQVWRDGGDGWRLVAIDVPLGAAVTDFIPPLGVLVSYRVVAVSGLPSTSEVTVSVLTDGACHAWVNGGPGWDQSVRLLSNVSVDKGAGIERDLVDYGRPSGLPVEMTGRAISRTWQVGADLWADWVQSSADQSGWADLDALATIPGPHCLRLPDGTRAFVSLSPASGSGFGVSSKRSVGVTATQTDFDEPGGDS